MGSVSLLCGGRGAGGGIRAAVMAGLACCCCLDFLIWGVLDAGVGVVMGEGQEGMRGGGWEGGREGKRDEGEVREEGMGES